MGLNTDDLLPKTSLHPVHLSGDVVELLIFPLIGCRPNHRFNQSQIPGDYLARRGLKAALVMTDWSSKRNQDAISSDPISGRNFSSFDPFSKEKVFFYVFDPIVEP